jgi:riboflavin synthase
MFTGLVQDVGVVERVEQGATTDLWIRTALASPFERGESIAVDGVCLTIVDADGQRFKVQAAPETLRRSTLGSLRPGAKVNLERALRLNDRLGGHLVQGHVDAVARIVRAREEGGSKVMTFELPPELQRWFIEKGSVAIDGVSLTVMTLGRDSFEVMLIPETRERTTLANKRVGDGVNLEADLIGKYVARLHELGRAPTGGLTLETLEAAGLATKE